MVTELPSEMLRHYGEEFDEVDRLASASAGELECLRTRELLDRFLPTPPAVVLDVGGAAGVYALPLAEQGHQVHLIDPVPRHVDQARAASDAQPEHPLASCSVGDARTLGQPDESVDAVLLLGPLYHLTERADRLRALTEARRVLRPGGVLFAGAISRYASFLNGVASGFLGDPDFVPIVRQDLVDGQHRNPTDKPWFFTTTFFHHPDELRAELVDAGFDTPELFGLECGVSWMTGFEATWRDPEQRAVLLEFLRAVESDPAMSATGSHFLGVAVS